MPAKYDDFNVLQQGNDEYIVAQPKNDRDEPVRFPGELKETDDTDGEWREVIKGMVTHDITEALNLEEGKGKLSREEAIQSLEQAEEGALSIVSEEQAEAVLDYFIDNDILESEGGKLVVLSDPEMLKRIASGDSDEDTNSKMLLNWVSAIEGCMSKIDDTIETVREAEEEITEEIGESSVSEKQARLKEDQEEVAQRLLNLTNGGQLDKSDLGPEDQLEYERLEDRLFHLDSMIEAIEGGELEEELRKTARQLGTQIDELKDIKVVLDAHQEKLQRAYKYEEIIETEEAMQMAKNLANVATTIANVESKEEKKEQQDAVAFAKNLASTEFEEVERTEDAEQADQETLDSTDSF